VPLISRQVFVVMALSDIELEKNGTGSHVMATYIVVQPSSHQSWGSTPRHVGLVSWDLQFAAWWMVWRPTRHE
jgi:hypothetical protein